MQKHPPRVPIRQSARSATGARTHVKIGGHEIVIDEPEQRGGTDLGPTPLDILIAALAGCTTVILNMIAAENEIPVHDLKMKLRSALDKRGVLGHEFIRRPLERIELSIELTTDASDGKIAVLKETLPKRCPVNVIFREAGIDVQEIWDVRRP